MKATITSEGFTLGGLHLPSFGLYQGEYLSINFPNGYIVEEEKQVVNILIGVKKIAELKVSDSLSLVSSDFKHSFLNLFLKSRKAFDILKRDTTLSEDGVNAALRTIGIGPDDKVTSLGFNERKLLALEIACSKTKNIIINCSDLDYSGISKIRDRIIPLLNSGGTVIELNYMNSRGRDYLLEAQDYPKVKMLNVKEY